MRPLRFATLISLFFVLGVGAVAAEATVAAESTDDPIVVIDVSDPMDQLSIDYVIEAIESEPAYLYILKIDSPGVSSGDVAALYEAILSARAPVVSWIGPFGAVAFGGSAYIANHADVRSAAPGAVVGYLEPVVQRDNQSGVNVGVTDEALADSTVVLTPEGELVPGFVDRLDPALSTLLISLDGTTVTRDDQTWELSTARVETVEGEDIVMATRVVKFVGPRLTVRFLRLASRPETTFLFLLIGLAFAVFEFYAAGRGLMAAVASVSILLAGYGAATLPIWWPSVGITMVGLGVLVWGLSKNRVDWWAVLGTAMLLVGGLHVYDEPSRIPPCAVDGDTRRCCLGDVHLVLAHIGGARSIRYTNGRERRDARSSMSRRVEPRPRGRRDDRWGPVVCNCRPGCHYRFWGCCDDRRAHRTRARG